MKASVSGIAVPENAFVIEGVVLSSYRPFGELESFELITPVTEFVEILQEPYKALVEDLLVDDEKFNDPDLLGLSGYPPLSELIQDSTLFLHTFRSYLAIDYFSHLLRDASSLKQVKFFITDITKVDCRTEHVEIIGKCIAYGTCLTFQST